MPIGKQAARTEDGRGSFLNIKLWVYHPDNDDEQESMLGPGWFMAVNHFDGENRLLTNEPVTVAQVAGIAKACSRRSTIDLMPYVETMTVQVLDTIDRINNRRAEAIKNAEKALAELRKIDKHAANGDGAQRHESVEQPERELERQAAQTRRELEEMLDYGEPS